MYDCSSSTPVLRERVPIDGVVSGFNPNTLSLHGEYMAVGVWDHDAASEDGSTVVGRVDVYRWGGSNYYPFLSLGGTDAGMSTGVSATLGAGEDGTPRLLVGSPCPTKDCSIYPGGYVAMAVPGAYTANVYTPTDNPLSSHLSVRLTDDDGSILTGCTAALYPSLYSVEGAVSMPYDPETGLYSPDPSLDMSHPSVWQLRLSADVSHLPYAYITPVVKEQVEASRASVVELASLGVSTIEAGQATLALAVWGDWLAVGIGTYDSGKGRVAMYKRTVNSWELDGYLSDSHSNGGQFGASLSMDGGLLAIGNPGATPCGVVDVYYLSEDGTTWTHLPALRLYAPDLVNGMDFGWAVTLTGTTLVACDPKHLTDKGICHKFSWDDSLKTMTHAQQIEPATLRVEWFGRAVSLDPVTGHVAVGQGEGTTGVRNVYVFEPDGTEHVVTTYNVNGGFGLSFSLFDGTLAVGAPESSTGENSNATNAGSVLVYKWSGTSYDLVQTISNTSPGEQFGYSVALYNDVLITTKTSISSADSVAVWTLDEATGQYVSSYHYEDTDAARKSGLNAVTVDKGVRMGVPGDGFVAVAQAQAGGTQNSIITLEQRMYHRSGSWTAGYDGLSLTLKIGDTPVEGSHTLAQVTLEDGSMSGVTLSHSSDGVYSYPAGFLVPHGATVTLGPLYMTNDSSASLVSASGGPLPEAPLSLPLARQVGGTVTSSVPLDPVAVALAGEWLFLSEVPGAGGASPGDVHIIQHVDGNWGTYGSVSVPAMGSDAEFGGAIAAEGRSLVVGAPGLAVPAVMAYLLNEAGTGWGTEPLEILPSTQGINSSTRFGASLDMHKDTLVVSAPEESDGRVYVFQWDSAASSWEEVHSLSPSTVTVTQFGCQVALSPDALTLAVAASGGTAGALGSVFVYTRYGDSLSSADWTLEDVIPLTTAFIAADVSLAVESSVLMVGIPSIDTVYMFECVSSSWGLSASGTFSGFGWGSSLAMLGNNFVVGAPLYAEGSTVLGALALVNYVDDGVNDVSYVASPHPAQLEGGGFGNTIAVDHDNARVCSFGVDSSLNMRLYVLEDVDVYLSAPSEVVYGLSPYSVTLADASTGDAQSGLWVEALFTADSDGSTSTTALAYNVTSQEYEAPDGLLVTEDGTVTLSVGVYGYSSDGELRMVSNKTQTSLVSVVSAGAPVSLVAAQMKWGISSDVYVTVLNANGYPICDPSLDGTMMAWEDHGIPFVGVYQAGSCSIMGSYAAPDHGVHSLYVDISGLGTYDLGVDVEVALDPVTASIAASDVEMPLDVETDVCMTLADSQGIILQGNLTTLTSSVEGGSATAVRWSESKQCYVNTHRLTDDTTATLKLENNATTVQDIAIKAVVPQDKQTVFKYSKASGTYSTALDGDWAALGGNAAEGVVLYNTTSSAEHFEASLLDTSVVGATMTSADISYKVSMSNGWLAVGRCVASDDDTSYVLLYHLEGGVYQRKQSFSGPSAGMYGCSLSLAPGMLAVGAYKETGPTTTGMVYVYELEKHSQVWRLRDPFSQDTTTYSTGSTTDTYGQFGYTVAVTDVNTDAHSHRLVIGTNYQDSYVYSLTVGGVWEFSDQITLGINNNTHTFAVATHNDLVGVAVRDSTHGVTGVLIHMFDYASGSKVTKQVLHHSSGMVSVVADPGSLSISGSLVAVAVSVQGRAGSWANTFVINRSTDRYTTSGRPSFSDATYASTTTSVSVCIDRGRYMTAGYYPDSGKGIVALYTPGENLKGIFAAPLSAGKSTVTLTLFYADGTPCTDRELVIAIGNAPGTYPMMHVPGTNTYYKEVEATEGTAVVVSALERDIEMPVSLWNPLSVAQVAVSSGTPTSVIVQHRLVGDTTVAFTVLNENGHTMTKTFTSVNFDSVSATQNGSSWTVTYGNPNAADVGVVGVYEVNVEGETFSAAWIVKGHHSSYTISHEGLVLGSPVPVCATLFDSAGSQVGTAATNVAFRLVETSDTDYPCVYTEATGQYCVDVTVADETGQLQLFVEGGHVLAETFNALTPFACEVPVPVSLGFTPTADFGTHVAISLPYFAVADPAQEVVHVFSYIAESVSHVQTLSDGVFSGPSFGTSVAMQGDTLVVGQSDTTGEHSGRVWVYLLSNGAYILEEVLTPSLTYPDMESYAGYGAVVALYADGTTTLVATSSTLATSPVAVYEREALGWSSPYLFSYYDVQVSSLAFRSSSSLLVGSSAGGIFAIYDFNTYSYGRYWEWYKSDFGYMGIGPQGIAAYSGTNAAATIDYAYRSTSGGAHVRVYLADGSIQYESEYVLSSRLATDGTYLTVSTLDDSDTDLQDSRVHVLSPHDCNAGWYTHVVTLGKDTYGGTTHRFGQSSAISNGYLVVGSTSLAGGTGVVHLYVPGATRPIGFGLSTTTIPTRERTIVSFYMWHTTNRVLRNIPYKYIPQYAMFNGMYVPLSHGRDGIFTCTVTGPTTPGSYPFSLGGASVTALGIGWPLTVVGDSYEYLRQVDVPNSFDSPTNAFGDGALVTSEGGLTVVVSKDAASTRTAHVFEFSGGTYTYGSFPLDDGIDSVALQNSVLYAGRPSVSCVSIYSVSSAAVTAVGTIAAPSASLVSDNTGVGHLISVSGNWMAVQADTHLFLYHLWNSWTYHGRLDSEGADVVKALSFNGGFLAVGKPDSNPTAAGSGTVVIKRLQEDMVGFASVQTITSPAPLSGERFGISLSQDAGTLVIGASQGDVSPGRVYRYGLIGTTYTHQDQSKSSLAECGSPLAYGEEFGHSVSLSGGQLLVGVPSKAGFGHSEYTSGNGGAVLHTASEDGTSYAMTHQWYGTKGSGLSEVSVSAGFAVTVGSKDSREVRLFVPSAAPATVTVTPPSSIVPLSLGVYTVAVYTAGGDNVGCGLSVGVSYSDESPTSPCVFRDTDSLYVCQIMTPPGVFTLTVRVNNRVLGTSQYGTVTSASLVQSGLHLCGFYGPSCSTSEVGTPASDIRGSAGLRVIGTPSSSSVSLFEHDSVTEFYALSQTLDVAGVTATAALSPWTVAAVAPAARSGKGEIHILQRDMDSGVWRVECVISLDIDAQGLGSRGVIGWGDRVGVLVGESGLGQKLVVFRRYSGGIWALDGEFSNIHDAALDGEILAYTLASGSSAVHRVSFTDGGIDVGTSDSYDYGSDMWYIDEVTPTRLLMRSHAGTDDTHTLSEVSIDSATLATGTEVHSKAGVPTTETGAVIMGGQVYSVDATDDRYGSNSGRVALMGQNLDGNGSLYPIHPNAPSTYAHSVSGDGVYLHVRVEGQIDGQGVAVYGPRLMPATTDTPDWTVTYRPGESVRLAVGNLLSQDGRPVTGVFDLYLSLDGHEYDAVYYASTGTYSVPLTAPCAAETYSGTVYARDCGEVAIGVSIVVAGDPKPHPSLTSVHHESADMSQHTVYLHGVCGDASYPSESVTVHWGGVDAACAYDAVGDTYNCTTASTPSGSGTYTFTVIHGGARIVETWLVLDGTATTKTTEIREFYS
ncbi:hypothetical protein KIPB_001433 [Kipferlia bialata]|uniref:Uncharacterized protein n=1 Tax=Kipferlia bialata TaxID=797122 RepID=A0A9K3GF93_9EUKA|nr:hypothetical protein KIPB_001433 [Kipferlia bialata]|eukprot:g1433.t1